MLPGSKSSKIFAWPIMVMEGRVNVSLCVPDFCPASESYFAFGRSSSRACEKSWADCSQSSLTESHNFTTDEM